MQGLRRAASSGPLPKVVSCRREQEGEREAERGRPLQPGKPCEQGMASQRALPPFLPLPPHHLGWWDALHLSGSTLFPWNNPNVSVCRVFFLGTDSAGEAGAAGCTRPKGSQTTRRNSGRGEPPLSGILTAALTETQQSRKSRLYQLLAFPAAGGLQKSWGNAEQKDRCHCSSCLICRGAAGSGQLYLAEGSR